MYFINELNDLEDILDELQFEDEPSIFDETNALDLLESALYLMEDYMNENPTAISEPDFEEDLFEDIKDLFYIQFEEEILNSEWVEDDINELLEDAFNIFITTFYPERSLNIQEIINVTSEINTMDLSEKMTNIKLFKIKLNILNKNRNQNNEPKNGIVFVII